MVTSLGVIHPLTPESGGWISMVIQSFGFSDSNHSAAARLGSGGVVAIVWYADAAKRCLSSPPVHLQRVVNSQDIYQKDAHAWPSRYVLGIPSLGTRVEAALLTRHHRWEVQGQMMISVGKLR